MMIDGVGRVVKRGEWWKLTYDGCGHEIWFDRVACRLFDLARVEHVVLSFYAECQSCAWSSSPPVSGISRRGGAGFQP
jgi:hypothetical protein